MTTPLDRPVNAGVKSSPRPTRIGWGMFGIAYLVFAALTLSHLERGIGDDPRRVNPNPGPKPYEPLFGFGNWPAVVTILTSLTIVGLVVMMVMGSWKQKRMHWTVAIAFAGLLTGWLDPLANWATFAIYDSGMLHFPLSWPYVDISPLLEPSLAFVGGYAAYYVLTGLGVLQAHNRLFAPRIKPTSWLGRRPLFAVFVGAFVIALPLNLAVQSFWMWMQIFVYTEAVGPILRIGTVHMPVIMIVYDSFIFAMVAVLCVRDEGDELVLAKRLAARIPHRTGRPAVTATRQVLVVAGIGLISTAIPLAVLAGLRVTAPKQPAYDQFPYPQVKIYDPYGNLERAGRPGPFYK